MKTKNFLFLLGFVLCSIAATAQIQFDAKVSKKTLGINERLRIDFEMNQDGDNFRPPNFENFKIVGGPNQSISNSWINGKRSFSKTYSYFLAPQSRGKLTSSGLARGRARLSMPIASDRTSSSASQPRFRRTVTARPPAARSPRRRRRGWRAARRTPAPRRGA